MTEKESIPVLLSELECQLILEFCSGRIGIDLSLKLGLAVPKGAEEKATVRLTHEELSHLIDVLKRTASLATTAVSARRWANDLADYLLKWDETEAVAI